MTEIIVTISGGVPTPPPVTITFKRVAVEDFDGSKSKTDGRKIYNEIIRPLPVAVANAIDELITGREKKPTSSKKDRPKSLLVTKR